MTHSTTPDNTSAQPQKGSLLGSFLLHFLLPALALAAAGWLAYSYLQSSPKAKRVPPPRSAPLVEVVQLEPRTRTLRIEAMGVVKPALQINLKPRVGGLIQKVSPEFVPGGYFSRDELILQLDPTDFELAVREAQANVDMARSALALEQGQQNIARREFELLGQTIDEKEHALVLRKPQLATAKAELDRALSALEQSKLNLERTVIRAPFNARVRSRDVDLGVQVTPSSNLAVLSGTDQYWIELTLPVNKLKWIRIPKNSRELGSAVRIYNQNVWGTGVYRVGRVIRLAADLEPEGRLARLLVTVDDPMSLKAENNDQPQLILDSFLRVEIEGVELHDSIAIDRKLVRDGDTVWLLNEQNELEIRPLQITFQGPDYVLINQGLDAQERVISTPLSAAVAGMPLRSNEQEPAPVEKP